MPEHDARPPAARRLPPSVVVAVVTMWINAAAGVGLGIYAIFELRPKALGISAVLIGLVWSALAVGAMRLRPTARVVAIALAALSIVSGLLRLRPEISTNLVILIALLTPSARAAFEARPTS